MKKLIVTLGFVCLATAVHAQRGVGRCDDADRHFYRESDLSILNAFITTIALSDPFVVADDTSDGKCFVNKSEVGSGLRFNAEFRVTDTIPLENNVTVSFVADSDRSDPFLLQVEVAAGDISFATIRPADLSTVCFGRDRTLVGTIQDLKVELFYSPPSPDHNDFRLDRAGVTFDAVTVQNPEPGIPVYADLTAAINNDLATNATHNEIIAILENTIRSQSYVTTTLPTTLTQLFWATAPGTQGAASICSTTLGAPPLLARACPTANCADYRIRP
jgi:hypothetical protein